MIPIPGQARIWIAMGHTDMRRGMPGLARQVQHGLNRDVFAGDLFLFRGRTGKRTTFSIQFASRHGCLSLASALWN
ncbi:IS66 family insertion sequence element accessory protein TnpB, partial [Rhizorhapis sp. SPR117]|uniref:IS66 family insertion sequence element accessory protein TnpB n=1 Tax=Rhizorhapis sp. SPR117 TaxID=2912611 RepID=UPI00403EB8A2